MRVALVSGARGPRPMGLELAEAQLLEALQRADGARVELRVVGGRAARRTARALGGRWCPALPGRASPRAWRGADLVHLTGLDVPPPPPGVPFVATVHDLAPLRFPDEGSLPTWTREIADRAELVLCPSRFTAGELTDLLGVGPERIRVVPNGPGHDLSSGVAPLPAGITPPFVLRLGGATQRKNLPLLLEAWPSVRTRTGATLALAGPQQAASSLDGVVVLGYVEAELVPRLIRSAAAVVLTSTYEGFGLPLLEGMAAGTPVVALRTPFAEEVCGDAALLVEPEELADALVHVLDGGADALAAAGLRRAQEFSWDRSAALVLDAYRAIRGAGP